MTSEAKPRIKITYATLRADNEEMHSGFEEAVTKARAGLGAHQQARLRPPRAVRSTESVRRRAPRAWSGSRPG